MNPWDRIRLLTSARVGLGRVGSALATKHVMEFQRAHSAARSAVWYHWDYRRLSQEVVSLGEEEPLVLKTQVEDRESYLRFPNKGRRLSLDSQERLKNIKTDIAIIVSDGLSALAIERHFLPFWIQYRKRAQESFSELRFRVFLVPFSRVAVADEIGQLTGAMLTTIFIGERPGLNSPDSLGIYLTYNPKLGNSDAQRNCISNIREPLGMSYQQAVAKLEYLMMESLRRQLSGVHLKDEMDVKLVK